MPESADWHLLPALCLMGEKVRDDLRWEPEELKPDAVDGEPGPESPPEFRKAALTEKPQTSHL